VELGHEIACHGWRWIHYQEVSEEREVEHVRLGMRARDGRAPARLVHGPRQPAHTTARPSRRGIRHTRPPCRACRAPTMAMTCRSGTEVGVKGGERRPHLKLPLPLSHSDVPPDSLGGTPPRSRFRALAVWMPTSNISPSTAMLPSSSQRSSLSAKSIRENFPHSTSEPNNAKAWAPSSLYVPIGTPACERRYPAGGVFRSCHAAEADPAS
jgi:hypothetical protein